MKGGGYQSFLDEIRTKAQTNCIAKFIIVDADRIQNGKAEEAGFRRLVEYCVTQNKKKAAPHFLIVDNPDFEYVACLHIADYKGQEVSSFIKNQMGFQSVEAYEELAEPTKTDAAISKAEKEYLSDGVLLDAREALPSLRRKRFK